MKLPRFSVARFLRGRFIPRRFINDERGQVLPMVAAMMVALIGMLGISVDVANSYAVYRKLQASTDAAALAGAATLPNSTATTVATHFAGLSSSLNNVTSLGTVSMVSGYPQVKCLTTLKNLGEACVAPALGNAVAVKQQVTIPLYFLRVVGKSTITLTASSTAAMRGSLPTPYNIAIVMDQTLSMMQYDSNCGATQMTCALSGVQVLLQALTPCAIDVATCTFTGGVATNSVDRVAMFGFPNITVGTASIDTSCTTPIPSSYYWDDGIGYISVPPLNPWYGVPTATSYSAPTAGATSYTPTGSTTATYQITPFISDYRTSNKSLTLNKNSDLVQAGGGASGCGSMLTPNYAGVFGTYYAGAIYAAQAALVAQAAQNPGSKNVIIFLSDGDATAPQGTNFGLNVFANNFTGNGLYPSWVGECGQGVTAAKAATAAGTRVYTVAYGAPTTGCSTDVNAGSYPNITPCQALASMASNPQFFFSDYLQSGSSSSCFSSAQTATSLSGIFQQIANDLTTGRLIPDSTT
jgi:Flp pilus assembly protein TadG